VSVLRDRKTGNLYVLDANIARRTPDQTIDTILDYYRARRYTAFAFESNQFQEFMRQEIEKRGKACGVYPKMTPLNHTTHKRARIGALQPLIHRGTLSFSRRHRLLLEQLRQFPRGAHDDGPDALEMAVSLAQQPVVVPRIWFIYPGRGDRGWGGGWKTLYRGP
jgi:predicted phage terminase large subunit-like protein